MVLCIDQYESVSKKIPSEMLIEFVGDYGHIRKTM